MSERDRDPGTEGLRENLSRIAPGTPEHGPEPELEARLERLRKAILGPVGERSSPSEACYNEPASRGAAATTGPRSRQVGEAPQGEGVPMKLQACSKCGAQFDVSTFTAGQQFTCGACGQVLTAHAAAKPAARTPGTRRPGAPRGSAGSAAAAPARGAAPRARTPAAGRAQAGPRKAVAGGPAAPPRGPQYQPVKRAGQAAPAGPAGRRAAAPSARRGAGRRGGLEEDERGRGYRRPSGGPNKAVLIGAAALVLVVVVLVIAMAGKDKQPASGGPDVADAGSGSGGGPSTSEPALPQESVKDIMGEYAIARPTLKSQYDDFINRLLALDSEDAKNGLRTVYEDYIQGPGRDDKDARRFLGYKEFPHEIPEDIAFRDYPYLTAVQAAFNKHWFAPDEEEEYQLAMNAWAETKEHVQKLINDHRFRAADEIRANLKKDKFFKDYSYAARWAEPYLICYSSKERLSEYELLSIPDKDERRLRLKELAKRKAGFEKILDEKAAMFQQLYKEFMRRYEKSLKLKDLMGEYGGRPDYEIGIRSFTNGVPLVVWIFDNREAFDEYHSKVTKQPMHSGVAGYFSPMTTYVYLYDEADNPANRVFEINKNVHEGTHQLEFWFTRQRNNWRKPIPGQDWFGEGIAEYIGSVQLQPDRKLKFIGVNVPRLKNMQMIAKALEKQNNEYKLFPVDKLVGFSSYGEVQSWGASTWQLNPGMVLGMFYQQSWAFTYFLNQYENGKYKERFEKFFDLVLHREVGYSKGDQAFKEAFRIRDEDDWEDLNDEFHEYVRDVLLKMNAGQWDYTPPARPEVGGE